MKYPEPKEQLGKKLSVVAYVITAAVLVLVGVMRRVLLRLCFFRFCFCFLMSSTTSRLWRQSTAVKALCGRFTLFY